MLTLVPPRVERLSDAPKHLYWEGEKETVENLLARPAVAIVGSRKPTAYGRQVTFDLAKQLAAAGVVIISGLAIGLDSEAHKGALASQGPTIAVLPGPLDNIAPAGHRNLATQIVEQGGALVTEYAHGMPIHKMNFIARNRIIAALADAVLVTEAAARSGSLHTAQFALDLGIPTLAVPGNIDRPTSAGANKLLKNSSAGIVTDVEDIFHALHIEPGRKQRITSSNPSEQLLLNLLEAGLHDGGALLSHSRLNPSAFNQALTMLEINGHVRALGGNQWSL